MLPSVFLAIIPVPPPVLVQATKLNCAAENITHETPEAHFTVLQLWEWHWRPMQSTCLLWQQRNTYQHITQAGNVSLCSRSSAVPWQREPEMPVPTQNLCLCPGRGQCTWWTESSVTGIHLPQGPLSATPGSQQRGPFPSSSQTQQHL